MAWPLRRVLAKGVLINTTWNPLGSFRLFSWCLWPFQNCRYQTKPSLSPENRRVVWEQIAWFCLVRGGKQSMKMREKGIPYIRTKWHGYSWEAAGFHWVSTSYYDLRVTEQVGKGNRAWKQAKKKKRKNTQTYTPLAFIDFIIFFFFKPFIKWASTYIIQFEPLYP